jgi:hypothetical protein
VRTQQLRSIKNRQTAPHHRRSACRVHHGLEGRRSGNHLWVLWTDYFKPPHFEKYPQLNTLFNEATKLAGGGGGSRADPPGS